MDLKHSLIYKIANCAMQSNRLTAQILKAFDSDLTPEEAVILDQICEIGRMTQRQIGSIVAKGPSSVSRHIDNLHRKGYVERSVDADDRRNTWITPTVAGHEFRRMMAKTDLLQIDNAILGISAKDHDAAERVLDAYIAYIGAALSDDLPEKLKATR